MTLVEPRVARSLGKIGVAAEDVILDSAAASVASDDDVETALHTRVADLRVALEEGLGPLLDASGPEGSTTRRKAARLAGHIRNNLEKLERTVVGARRDERDVGRRHVARVTDALRPLGRPQERVYGLLPFLVRHGPALVDRLMETVEPFVFDHLVVRLD